MLTTFSQCNFSLEFPKLLGQSHICYHCLSVSGISKITHRGILIYIYIVQQLHLICSLKTPHTKNFNSGKVLTLFRSFHVNKTSLLIEFSLKWTYLTGWKYAQNLIQRPCSKWSNSQVKILAHSDFWNSFIYKLSLQSLWKSNSKRNLN